MAQPMSGGKTSAYGTETQGTGKNIPKFLRRDESCDGLHKLLYLKSMRIQGTARFSSHLAFHLPDVAGQMEYDDFGILHLEAGALNLATRDAIARRDWQTAAKHFDFAAEMMEGASPELHDALSISYLGNLLYGEMSINYAKARSLLPKPLAAALEKIERHYADTAHRWQP